MRIADDRHIYRDDYSFTADSRLRWAEKTSVSEDVEKQHYENRKNLKDRVNVVVHDERNVLKWHFLNKLWAPHTDKLL